MNIYEGKEKKRLTLQLLRAVPECQNWKEIILQNQSVESVCNNSNNTNNDYDGG